MKAARPLAEPVVEEVKRIEVEKKKIKSFGKLLKKSIGDLETRISDLIEHKAD